MRVPVLDKCQFVVLFDWERKYLVQIGSVMHSGGDNASSKASQKSSLVPTRILEDHPICFAACSNEKESSMQKRLHACSSPNLDRLALEVAQPGASVKAEAHMWF